MERTIEIEELLGQAGWLRRLAAGLVADPQAADDLVQETWIAALRSPPEAGRAPRPWLARVLGNLASNRRRDERRRREHEADIGPERPVPAPDALAQEVELQRLLAEAMGKLEEPLRSVVVLRYFHGLDSAQIARELGLPASTVRSRLAKALGELRAELDRRFGGERKAWVVCLGGLLRTEALAPVAATTSVGAGLGLAALALVVTGAVLWRIAPSARSGELPEVALAAPEPVVDLPRAQTEVPATAEETTQRVELPAQAATPEERAALASLTGDGAAKAGDDRIHGVVLIDGAEADHAVVLEIRRNLFDASGFVTTDERGRFALAAEARGFEVRVSGYAFADIKEVWRNVHSASEGVLELDVFSMPVLKGRVLVADTGAPLACVRSVIELKWSWSDKDGAGNFAYGFQTDLEGRFALPLIKGEQLSGQIWFEAPDMARRGVEIPAFERAEGKDLGDIGLESAAVVLFRVLDREGRPLGRAEAHPVGFERPGMFGSKVVRSDAEGRGELPCVPVGGAEFLFGAPGCSDEVLTLRAGDAPVVVLAPAAALELELARGDGGVPPTVVHVTAAPRPFVGDELDRPEILFPGTPCHVVMQSATSLTLACTPNEAGWVELVGLRPGVELRIDVLDLGQHVLATRFVTLAAEERQRLEIPLGR
jgi:RNA polymerase sigma factor (sigma-70 family)